MPRRAAVSVKSARLLVGVLLCVKLMLLVWNALAFDGRSYDAEHHADRALFGGLKPGKLNYDPPPYYLPALAVARPSDVARIERSIEPMDGVARRKPARVEEDEVDYRGRLLGALRHSNVLWVGFFYLAWICYAFPRLLSFQGWFLASLLLLALPGYQKLAVMSHPDNLFLAVSAGVTCAWLSLRERWLGARAAAATTQSESASSGIQLVHLVGFALAIGFVGLTRPLAIVPVAVFGLVALVYVYRATGPSLARLLPRLALVTTLVVVLSGSWYALRWQRTGELTNAYRDDDMSLFRERKPGFSYAEYFTTFHTRPLLDTPSRLMGGSRPTWNQDSPHANSFFTLLYSEIWGDHWLNFSGAKLKEGKAWPKRTTLFLALPTLALVVTLGLTGLLASFASVRDAWRAATGSVGARLVSVASRWERELVLLALTLLGAALFVWWQAGPALMPGKNSSIKFIYVATLFPPALALMFARALPERAIAPLVAYLLVLFTAAFPVAMYWPS